MKKLKHTPKPWILRGFSTDHKWITIESPNGQLTIKVDSDDCDPRIAMQDAQFIVSAPEIEEERDELLTQIDAWQSVFGTSQLSHALAKLERLEKDKDKSIAALEKIKEGLDVCESCGGTGNIIFHNLDSTCPSCNGNGVVELNYKEFAEQIIRDLES
jgi:hypothetical protein